MLKIRTDAEESALGLAKGVSAAGESEARARWVGGGLDPSSTGLEGACLERLPVKLLPT